MPQSMETEREQRLNEVLAVYYQEEEAGHPPNLQTFLAQHADLAGELASFFAAKREFEQDATPLLTPALPHFDDYELLEELGRGGMGVVYKARQKSLQREVALKMILTGRLASSTEVQRFHREAEAVAGLDHPHIVPIYEVGERDGIHYFSMKLIEGGSLANQGARGEGRGAGKEGQRKGTELLAIVARAVHYAHERGILHRDLKPSNILLDRDGRPHVTDFGLAKRLPGPDQQESTVGLTASQAIVGTPSYLPPEQAQGNRLTTASDVNSLGAILYELMTGQPPFRSSSPLKTLRLVLDEEPKPPGTICPGLDRDLETICMKCLHKEPARRYGSAAALADDLERRLAGEPIQARPIGLSERLLKWARRRPAVAALVALLILTAIVGFGGILNQWRHTEAARGEASERADAAEQARQVAEQAQKAEAEARRAAEVERDAKNQALGRADGLRLTAHSAAALNRDPALALLLAIEGARRAPGLLANDTLLDALAACHETRTVRVPEGSVAAALYSPDGKRLLATNASQSVRIWDAETGNEMAHWSAYQYGDTLSAWSPDGRHVVTWYTKSYGTTYLQPRRRLVHYTSSVARVYDAATGKLVCLLKGHGKHIMSAAFSPDGQRLVTASQDGTARVWQFPSGKELLQLKCRGAVGSARFSPDGRRVLTVAAWMQEENDRISGGPASIPLEIDPPDVGPTTNSWSDAGPNTNFNQEPAYARLWDSATGKEIIALWKCPLTAVFPALTELTNSLDPICGEFSADGRQVMIGFTDEKTIAYVWDLSTKVEPILQEKAEDFLAPPCLSPDRRLVLSVSGKLGRLTDVATRTERFVLRGHERPIRSARFSNDGKRIVTASDDRTVRLWDTATGEQVSCFRGHAGAVTSAVFRPDGRQVASAAEDGTVRLWDVAAPSNHARPLLGHQGPVTSVAISPDGRRLLTASTDSTVRLWDAASGRQTAVLQGLSDLGDRAERANVLGPVQSAQFGPDGRRVLVMTMQQKVQTVDRRGKTISEQTFHPARIFDAETGKELLALPGCEGNLSATLFSPDGSKVLVGERNSYRFITRSQEGGGFGGGGRNIPTSVVRIHDRRTGKVLLTLPHHYLGVEAAAFSPDGKVMATACCNQELQGQVRLWETDTGKLLLTFDEDSHVGSLAFSPDGRRLLSVLTSRSSCRLRDVTTGKPLALMQGQTSFLGRGSWDSSAHPPTVNPFSPDCTRLVTVCQDMTARVWELATGRLLLTLKGHQGYVCSATFNSDGTRLVTASDDETARIWDAATGKELMRLSGHKGGVLHAIFTSDGQRVLTGSHDGTGRLWSLDLLAAAEARKPRELTPEERQRYEVEGK